MLRGARPSPLKTARHDGREVRALLLHVLAIALPTLLVGCTPGSNDTGSCDTSDTGDSADACGQAPANGWSAPVAAEVGEDFSCLLTSGGAVFCWGDYAHGQLGRGTAGGGPFLTPLPVQGLSTGITQITAGYLHACARTDADDGS